MLMTDFTEEHVAFRSVVRDFARRELAPHVERWELAGELPLDAVSSMAELGLFGIVFPEQWGGSGGDFTSLCIAIEEIGTVSQSLGITLSAAVGLGANPIHSFGNDEQKARWLPDLVAGRRLGAFGLTEPDAGSDAGATRTARPPRRRRVGHRRRQGVHHQLGHAHHLDDHRHGPNRRRHQRVRRSCRHPWVGRRARVPQARLARQRHARADAGRMPRARRAHAGRAGQWAAQLPGHPRRRPHRDLGPRRRLRAGVPRHGRRVRPATPGVRRSDRPLPGPGVPARRPGRRRREQPQPDLRGGRD